jgi:hypothetical protein
MSYPVEPKTQAAGVTAAVSGAALWLLSTYVFKGSVPDGVASMVYIAVPGVLAFVAAYLAPHQHRDPAPVLAVPASGTAPAVSLTGEQMDAVRDALAEASGRMEQTAGDERKVTISQMVPPSSGGTPP